MTYQNPKHAVFYDGSCGLCSKTIQFIKRWDKSKNIKLLTNSETNRASYGIPTSINSNQTIVLLSNGYFYTEATAFFKICRLLGSRFLFIRLFELLPLRLSNNIYRLIARNRKMFGAASCKL